jgi:ribose transport system ATP-binding protein
MREPAVRLIGLGKSFGHTRALDGATLALRRGTVHALVGGNGSGKSTAIKILAGVHAADEGAVAVGVTEWSPATWSAETARQAGLRFVHQDLGLFDPLSVAENVALGGGYPTRPGGSVRWRRLTARVAALLARFELELDPDQPVGTLRPAQRTMLAIARALQDDDGERAVLVLDEPTATLPAHESEILLQAVRRRAERGQTVLIVSHRMSEVLAVAHDFTVFRDGRTVATLVEESPSEAQLVELMTGRDLRSGAPEGAASGSAAVPAPGRPAALELNGLTGGPLRGVSLAVQPGEIVGLTGLVGSGRSSLLRTVFGVHAPAGGSITLAGRRQTGREDVTDRMAQGVAYVPEDRVGESAFATLTVRENLSASVLGQFWRPWGMDAGAERRSAAELVGRHQVKASSVEAGFASLSGGNQQKAVLGRWLRREPALLLLDEPTQGVDVMSRRQIYRTIREAAARGCAVVVASSDFMELCELCDRVAVLRDGTVGTQLAGSDLTADHLTAATQSSMITTGDLP